MCPLSFCRPLDPSPSQVHTPSAHFASGAPRVTRRLKTTLLQLISDTAAIALLLIKVVLPLLSLILLPEESNERYDLPSSLLFSASILLQAWRLAWLLLQRCASSSVSFTLLLGWMNGSLRNALCCATITFRVDSIFAFGKPFTKISCCYYVFAF